MAIAYHRYGTAVSAVVYLAWTGQGSPGLMVFRPSG